MKKFVGLRAKTYSYLKGDNDEDKYAKGTKKCVIKRNLEFRSQKNYLNVSQIENEIKISLQFLNDLKAFIKYSIHIDDIYKNIEEYNQNKKRKILIVDDDMIAGMLSNKKLNPIITELFIRG